MIKAQAISKRIGKKAIIREMDLEIGGGEFLAILGPNGAGKSTLLKILSLLMRPSEGRLEINGLDAVKEAEQVRPLLGVISHQTYLYDALTASENLEFYGRMYGVAGLTERVREVIKEVGLEFSLHDQVGTFSRGMQQRLAIARAILHRPRILLLDEPQTGLDQQALDILYQVIGRLKAEGSTVVMVTHILDYGLEACDRLLVLVQGKPVFLGNKPETLAGVRETYSLAVSGVRA
ncbi:MAG: ABC transporter ATP-binding protein [Clostridia bacterium]|nr:ABC transporter ATP-binding protein [Clostridia bacterium]